MVSSGNHRIESKTQSVKSQKSRLKQELLKLEYAADRMKVVSLATFVILGMILLLAWLIYQAALSGHTVPLLNPPPKWEIPLLQVVIAFLGLATIIIVARVVWIQKSGRQKVISELDNSGLAQKLAMTDPDIEGLYQAMGLDLGRWFRLWHKRTLTSDLAIVSSHLGWFLNPHKRVYHYELLGLIPIVAVIVGFAVQRILIAPGQLYASHPFILLLLTPTLFNVLPTVWRSVYADEFHKYLMRSWEV